MAGFRLTTKVQVSGWRFLLRRVEHAIVRRDTRMFDDPLQFYSRAVSLGIVIAVLVCAGAALLAYFKPLGKRGGDNLLVDRTTNQLYVVMGGTNLLHPVYNLTSAQLVLGHPGTPSAVKSDELNRMPKGQPIGIPGAPYATPVSPSANSMWTLCDTVTKPESVAPAVNSSIIVLPLVVDGSVGAMRSDQGVLVSFQDKDWLVTDTGRHAIELGDRAITSAVGIPVTAKATPISEGLFNALPNAGPWLLPQVPAAGAPNNSGLPANLVIGSVFQTVTDSDEQKYVVLPDGVAKVNDTTSFLALDERFHFLIAQSIDCVAAWDTIQDIKAQMDRVRYLSLPEVSPLELLIKQHARIVSALKEHDADGAEEAMRAHLREILVSLGPVAERNPDWFEPDEGERVHLAN